MIPNLIDLRNKSNVPKFHKGRWVTNEEGELLYNLARFFNLTLAFESGTANGFSTCWLAHSSPAMKVNTFDPVSRAKVWDEEEFIEIRSQITYHQASFEEVTPFLRNRNQGALIFIDGDHTTSGIRRDWSAIEDSLLKGDLVVFHDLNEPPVSRQWLRIQADSEDSRFLEFDTKRQMGVMVY